MRLLTLQGVPIKPRNWREIVAARITGRPLPPPVYADSGEVAGDAWIAGGGMSAPGLGDRPTAWPAFSGGDPRFGTANPTCATCGGRLRGKKKCTCTTPDWRVKSVRVGAGEGPAGMKDNPSGPQSETWGVRFGSPAARRITPRLVGKHQPKWHESPDFPPRDYARPGQLMQLWHTRWLQAAHHALHPGGVLKAMGATRTFHRLCAAMEAAGFEIGGMQAWCYFSGFAKGPNVGKLLGRNAAPEAARWEGHRTTLRPAWEAVVHAYHKGHAPPREDPAPFLVLHLLRKPPARGVAANVVVHGVGALNIEACRIGTTGGSTTPAGMDRYNAWNARLGYRPHPYTRGAPPPPPSGGRYPMNLMLQRAADPATCPAADLDRQAGGKAGAAAPVRGTEPSPAVAPDAILGERQRVPGTFYADQGGPSRFFVNALPPASPEDVWLPFDVLLYLQRLCCIDPADPTTGTIGGANTPALADPAAVLARLRPGAHVVLVAPADAPTGHTAACAFEDAGFEVRDAILLVRAAGVLLYSPKAPPRERTVDGVRGDHPTVKPQRLMRALLTGARPPVLDPFAGSGSTLVAAQALELAVGGIEKNADYVAWARRRLFPRGEKGEPT